MPKKHYIQLYNQIYKMFSKNKELKYPILKHRVTYSIKGNTKSLKGKMS